MLAQLEESFRRLDELWQPYPEVREQLRQLLGQMFRATSKEEAMRLAEERYRIAVEAGLPQDLVVLVAQENEIAYMRP